MSAPVGTKKTYQLAPDFRLPFGLICLQNRAWSNAKKANASRQIPCRDRDLDRGLRRPARASRVPLSGIVDPQRLRLLRQGLVGTLQGTAARRRDGRSVFRPQSAQRMDCAAQSTLRLPGAE